MPFYTFKCPKCKDVKEVLQGMNDKPPTCEKCNHVNEEFTKMELSQ